MFRFAHPEYLYLLLILPVLFFFYLYISKARKSAIKKYFRRIRFTDASGINKEISPGAPYFFIAFFLAFEMYI